MLGFLDRLNALLKGLLHMAWNAGTAHKLFPDGCGHAPGL